MKTKIIKLEPAKDFKPFKIEIEVETIQEARLLFLLADRPDLSGVFSEYPTTGPSATTIPGKLHYEIRDEIESQGFKI